MASAGALLLVVVTGSLAFIAGRVTSPEQRAAQAQPPPVTLAKATAQRRSLHPDVVTRGSITLDRPVTVEVTPPAGGHRAVITRVPVERGDRIRSGDLLVEVAGQPTFALRTPFSGYRDLTVGDRGTDVTALKTALRGSGFVLSRGDALNVADLSALRAFTRRRGYDLPSVASEPASEPASTTPPTTASTAPSATPAAAASATARRSWSFPASWWVGVPRLPATVSAVGPRVGALLNGTQAQFEITSEGPVLSIPDQPGVDLKLEAGARLTFSTDGGGDQKWQVAQVRPATSASGEGSGSGNGDAAGGGDAATSGGGNAVGASSSGGLVVTVQGGIPTSLLDATGKVTATSPDAGATLAVPLTAVTTSASGKPSVVVSSGGRQSEIEVVVGDQADGWVAITPVNGTVVEGTTVVLR
jgi:hypothetical protein